MLICDRLVLMCDRLMLVCDRLMLMCGRLMVGSARVKTFRNGPRFPLRATIFPAGPRFSLLDHDSPRCYDYLARTTVLPTEISLGLKAEMMRL
jgi:hypothetical protein